MSKALMYITVRQPSFDLPRQSWPLLNRFRTVQAHAVHSLQISLAKSRVAQSCYSVIGDKPFLWSKPKFDPP